MQLHPSAATRLRSYSSLSLVHVTDKVAPKTFFLDPDGLLRPIRLDLKSATTAIVLA
jgi:hypothetical protein